MARGYHSGQCRHRTFPSLQLTRMLIPTYAATHIPTLRALTPPAPLSPSPSGNAWQRQGLEMSAWSLEREARGRLYPRKQIPSPGSTNANPTVTEGVPQHFPENRRQKCTRWRCWELEAEACRAWNGPRPKPGHRRDRGTAAAGAGRGE